MSDLESSSFHLQQLGHFPHFFSDEERSELNKWGAHAEGLANGTTLPTSEREAKFVEVAGGKSSPVTRFQRLWLRYRQAVLIQEKLLSSEKNLVTVTHQLDSAKSQIEQLQEDVIRLTKLWKLARDSVNTPKTNPVNNLKSSAQSSSSHQNCRATQVETSPETSRLIYVRDVTNRDQYFQFIEKGLSSLSDNEIFTLFNLVDALGLTHREVADFNIEHMHRAFKYQSSESIGSRNWDWRDQNEAK
ncbi:MAG: DUF413 domain-containing protein [Betaproteobacteria bacterium]